MSEHNTESLEGDALEPLDTACEALDIDIHRGAIDVPAIESQLQDTDGLRNFGIPFEEAVKHMSVNKYQSVGSMIREYISNMAATCLEAAASPLTTAEYSPTIHVAYYPDTETLVMEDNGMGMSDAEVSSVGTQLGTTTNRYKHDRGGKYGIGLLSGLVGVGIEGAFYMHSRSRRTDEYMKGLWAARGFVDIPDLADKLEANQYGTRFEFPLTDPDIDVTEAIVENSKHSRVPVLFTERSMDGTVTRDDEFGGRSDTPFQAIRSSTEGDVVIDRPEFRAVHGSGGDDRTILLDVPIRRNDGEAIKTERDGTRIGRLLPYHVNNTDVLFRSEEQEIVAGPHEGRTRVSDSEYDRISDDHREQYIPASQCSPSDIWTPSPAGDRDRFEENPRFWRWLYGELVDVFEARLQEIVSRATATSVAELPRADFQFVAAWMDNETNSSEYGWNARMLSRRLERRGVAEVPDRVLTEFSNLSSKVDRCSRGGDPWRRENRERVRAYAVIEDTPNDATVWVAARPSAKKAAVVWDDHEGHVVVQVKSRNIDEFAELYGWRPLNYVSETTLDEFDVSEETQRWYERPDRQHENPNAGKAAPNRSLTLHYIELDYKSNKGYKTRNLKRSAQYLRAYLEARAAGHDPSQNKPISDVVVFPSNTDANLSDYRRVLGTDGRVLANCAVKTWGYLADLNGVTHIKEMLTEANTTEFRSSVGQTTLPSMLDRYPDREIVVHHVAPATYPALADEEKLQAAAEYLTMKGLRIGKHGYGSREVCEAPLYALVTTPTMDRLSPLLRNERVFVLAPEQRCLLSHQTAIGNVANDAELYAYANLPNWRDSAEYDLLTDRTHPLANGYLGVLNGFIRIHDGGGAPPSERPNATAALTGPAPLSTNSGAPETENQIGEEEGPR